MNRELLKQAIDVLKDVAQTLAWQQWGAHLGYTDNVSSTSDAVHIAKTAIAALEAELAKPNQDADKAISELERLYENALKREFALSQALEEAVDSNLDKLMAMSDEQVRALAGFEGHHPDDLAALARQTFEIALLKAELAKPDPEPVAWVHVSDTKMPWDKTLPYKFTFVKDESWACAVPLYTAPTEPNCWFPTCHSQEFQTNLANDVASELVTGTNNCSHHPDAPHGPDGTGCKCHNWAPGDAS